MLRAQLLRFQSEHPLKFLSFCCLTTAALLHACWTLQRSHLIHHDIHPAQVLAWPLSCPCPCPFPCPCPCAFCTHAQASCTCPSMRARPQSATSSLLDPIGRTPPPCSTPIRHILPVLPILPILPILPTRPIRPADPRHTRWQAVLGGSWPVQRDSTRRQKGSAPSSRSTRFLPPGEARTAAGS